MTDEQQYHEGGYIPGDPVPVPLRDIGYVITREQLEKFGTDFLDRLNRAPAPVEADLLDQLRNLPEVSAAASMWFHGWVEIAVALRDWTWDAMEQPSALIDAFAREHVRQFTTMTRFVPPEPEP